MGWRQGQGISVPDSILLTEQRGSIWVYPLRTALGPVR